MSVCVSELTTKIKLLGRLGEFNSGLLGKKIKKKKSSPCGDDNLGNNLYLYCGVSTTSLYYSQLCPSCHTSCFRWIVHRLISRTSPNPTVALLVTHMGFSRRHDLFLLFQRKRQCYSQKVWVFLVKSYLCCTDVFLLKITILLIISSS